MFNWLGHSIPFKSFSTSCITFHLPFCWLFFVCFLFTCMRFWLSQSPKPVKGWLHFIVQIEFKRPHGAGTYAISEPEVLVISSLHRQYKNLRNFGYLLLLVFFFNTKSLHHFIIFLRNWNSGFNSGSGSTLISLETLQFRKKNSVKNYIHSSLVLDQKLSDKGIVRLYCLLHACHSKMSVFRCLSDLSVQIVRRSTLNRLEVLASEFKVLKNWFKFKTFRNVTHEFCHNIAHIVLSSSSSQTSACFLPVPDYEGI